MEKKPKKKLEFGTMSCRECKSPVKVMKAENDTLSYRCLAWGCDDSNYASLDTHPNKHARWMSEIKPVNQPEKQVSENQQKGEQVPVKAAHPMFGEL